MIARYVSQAIQESKWLKLKVIKDAKTRHYWACITGIEPETHVLHITAFNHQKVGNEVKGLISTGVLFEHIKEAYVLEHTSYDRPTSLIPFIERNIDKLDWLDFKLNDDRLLNYYRKCLKYDTDPYSKAFTLIDGINEKSITLNNNEYSLSLEQQGQLINHLERISKQAIFSKKNETTDLALNVLSIKTPKGLYIIAHRIVTFNPKKGSLIVGADNVFNPTFLKDTDKTSKHSLYAYFDRDYSDFENRLVEDSNNLRDELMQALRPNELLDDSPYFIDIVRKYPKWINKEFDYLSEKRNKNQMNTPLKAFFGEMSHDLAIPNKPLDEMILLDIELNPDQIRSIHNGLNDPITYVQGPPGTGKTTAIHSLLVSAFFNGRTVLVSSNNNKPINDLYAKLKHMKKEEAYDIYMPILRLGNDQSVFETLTYVRQTLDKVRKPQPDKVILNDYRDKNKKRFKAFNETLAKYEERQSMKERLDVIQQMTEQFGNELRATSILQEQMSAYQKRFDELKSIDEDSVRKNLLSPGRSLYSWLFYTSIQHYQMLLKEEFKDLHDILKLERKDDLLKQFNEFVSKGTNLRRLLQIFPIILTTNQSAYRLGEPDVYFDLVVMDEAGQCSIGYALIPILRGKRLILVGDEKQLRPVLSLSKEANKVFMKQHRIPSIYNYNLSSILLLMKEVDQYSKKILLREHYRCKRQIIDFCNQRYYGGSLIIKDQSNDQSVFAIDVKQDKERRPAVKNTSMKEIETIINHIKENNITNCGVVSPFHNQAELMKEEFKRAGLEHIPTGSVHLFQGDEKSIIFCSMAINQYSSNRTFGWLKNNEELINVAMTRAKDQFYLVGDIDNLKSRATSEETDIDGLMLHIESKGTAPIQPSDEIMSKQTKAYLSEKEKELYETLRHLFSMSNAYYVEKQVKVSQILEQFSTKQLFDYGTKSVFDFVVYSKGFVDRLELVIELDGPEHDEDEEVKANDELKQQICDANGIKLHRIKNPFVRRYQMIRDVLTTLLAKI